jgi:D-amino-acid dehydrogenase
VKVICIDCGLIGITTAYCLHRKGCDVTFIDREEGPGRDTSFADGALLTPSMAEPWNTPGYWRTLLKSLTRSDAPLQLRFRTLPPQRAGAFLFSEIPSRHYFIAIH